MRTATRVFLALWVFLGFCLTAEEVPLASKTLIQALVEEVSGEIAYQYTVQISQYDRIQASKGWHEAAVLIQKKLEEMGYTDVSIEGWPSNGSRYYYTYRTPIGWGAKRAELWMVSPERERLCSFEELPLTLVKHSNSTDVEAELIDVGTGVGEDSYKEKDVRGKVVLATAYSGDVMREAVVKRGALGVVTWYPPEVRPGYPNMIRYTAVWPTWEEKDKIGFGFNVSKQQGWKLKKMLDDGRQVVLKAYVEAEYYDSQIEVLTAALPGREEPGREVMIIGHLCHPQPSANDNASGSGGMLEMARALKKMIDKGLVRPPRRTIRFLWVPEFYGTVPYIQAHLERTRNTLSVINCDMIGEDLHLTGGTFNITCTPDSMPSYLNDVVVNFARQAEHLNLTSLNGSLHPFAFRVHPFSGGSDHYLFNDGALKVPAVMFGHGDVFHHTSLDTLDKVDPTELRRVCFVALGASYYMADASDGEALAMSRLILRNGLGRLAQDCYDSLSAVLAAEKESQLRGAYAQVLNVLRHSSEREGLAVLSTRVFCTDPKTSQEARGFVEPLKSLNAALMADAQAAYGKKCRDLGIRPEVPARTKDAETLSRLIPVRDKDFVCPLQGSFIEDKIGPDATEGVKIRGNAAYEVLNFADGRRSITDIADAVSAEFGPLDIQDVLAFFRVLEKAGLVKLISR